MAEPSDPPDVDPESVKAKPNREEAEDVALDADLNENDPVGFESPSQMIALGLEFNIFNFLQLRTGYLHNLKAAANIDEPGSYTAGVGLNVFGVHVDAAAMTNGNENDLGVYAQLGVNF